MPCRRRAFTLFVFQQQPLEKSSKFLNWLIVFFVFKPSAIFFERPANNNGCNTYFERRNAIDTNEFFTKQDKFKKFNYTSRME